ncbi:MAG TPA: GH92 family glycosyl hydrolase [Bryobacteraceae bacterium]|nr:GH92 family glycosyl hydrolase [Bryobacteraceae bacterium]
MTTYGLALILLPLAGFSQVQEDPAALVNPFVGSRLSNVHDYGKTVPGAVRPFGLLYWSPDMTDDVFYLYDKPVTRGFSLTHISGPGCGLFGDVPIFPMLDTPQAPSSPKKPAAYYATIDHADEQAVPGYYQAALDSGIDVRLAAEMRSGIGEFHFPAGASRPTLRIDLAQTLSNGVNLADVQLRNRMITGSVASGGICGHRIQYRLYFAIEADREPLVYGTFDELGVAPGNKWANGPRVGAYWSFAASTRMVRIRVGISFVSVANAQANLRREIPDWDFEKVRQDARAAWNDALGRVQVQGGTDSDRRVFYTALYHSLIHPSVFSDVNGEYLGFDGEVHTDGGHPQYTNFSGWDIYRSQVQLLAMLFPKEASDMAQSLVRDAGEGGGALPRWAAANDDAGAMVGDPSDCILAGMYAFGARDFDTKAALAAMLRGANDPEARARSVVARPYLREYLERGYIPVAPRGYGVTSIALEYENADFAISRFADALGDSDNARKFLVRSSQWRKLFDPETKYIRPRGSDGAFVPDFDIGAEANFVEGNSAQYTWMVPFDLAGLIQAIGGPEAARSRLDEYFSQNYDLLKRGPYFFLGNEPCFGNPWVYNWTGHPWRTQEVVRKTLRDLFTAGPEGLPGNDDLGATSSWIVLAQLGIYPEIPGVGGVTLNSPTFPDVTVRLGDRSLHITAPGAPDKLYVQNVAVDGSPVRNWWIDWDRLSKASKLSYTLSATPTRQAGEAPPSFSPEEASVHGQ